MSFFLKTAQRFNILRNFSDNQAATIKYVSTAALLEKSKQPLSVSKDEIELFDKTFPSIINNLKSHKHFSKIEEVSSRFENSMLYNVPKGKKNRGLMVLAAYKHLEEPQRLTDANIQLANILGWSVEMLQGFFLMIDDLTDGSENRRGQPCWYRRPDIGFSAVNDGLLMEGTIYLLLKIHFLNHPAYANLLDVFHEATLITTIGQIMDCNVFKMETWTMKRYEQIIVRKTAYYSFYLPIALALHLANRTSPEIHEKSKEILLEIGKYFQIQDDFIDCFGDPSITGKVGTDVQNGKCTWLAIKALENASSEDRKFLIENYGINDAKCIHNVKRTYLDLGIPKIFADYEEKVYNDIMSKIRQLPVELPQELFDKIVLRIFKRKA